MKQIKFYIVDAFTSIAYKGNPAGVVLCQQSLTTSEMQNIAKELNLSETAFLYRSTDEHYHFDVKYFTPADEVDFCGHATIGAAWIIANELHFYPEYPQLLLNTNIGIVPIEWQTKNNTLVSLTMTQAPPKSKRITTRPDYLASLLGVDPDAIDTSYPVGLGFSGNWHLLVPMKSTDSIKNAKPDLEKLAAFNKEIGCITTHLYTFCEKSDKYRLYTRDFAPAIGIPEDPVTGSANGALCAFLIKENILDSTKDHHFLIKQGNSMDREGYLHTQIVKNNDSFDIKIGGEAVLTIKGVINV